MATTTRFLTGFSLLAVAVGCSGPKGADGAPGVATAQPPLQLGSAGELSISTASAASGGALSAADWASFNAKVGPSDPRLTDARVPVPGSPDYIHNGTTQQAADISISGGVRASAFTFSAPVTRVLGLPPSAFLPAKAGVTYDGQGAGAGRWVTAGSFPTWLVAPVSLPDGAQLMELVCNVIDNSTTSSVSIAVTTSFADGTTPQGDSASSSVALASPTFQRLTVPLGAAVSAYDTLYSVAFMPSASACGNACQLLGCWLTYSVSAVQ